MSRIPIIKLLFASLVHFVISFIYATTTLAGIINYEYDELDRLHVVTMENGVTKITYEYDEIGNLISRTVTGNTDTTPPITTASPSGGTYLSALIVTLSANKQATIYYTTDSTTPTTSSAVYTSPLSISANTTLWYFAKDLANNSEIPKSQIYTITTCTPNTQVKTGYTYYTKLQDAYRNAAYGATIQLLALEFNESLTTSIDKPVITPAIKHINYAA